MATRRLATTGATAKVGTEEWAQFLHHQFLHILLREKGEVFTFTRYWDEFVLHQGWTFLRDETDKPFPSYARYAMGVPPHGLGMTASQYQIHVEAGTKRGLSLMEKASAATPLAKHGEIGNNRSRHDKVISTQQGNSADYLTRRIARDRPDILEKLQAGEYPSARAAAKDAGFIKDDPPLVLLKRAWRKASPGERDEFLAFISPQKRRTA